MASRTTDNDQKHDKLGDLKMLVALDALLRHSSVSLAAEELNLQVSSLSRLLQTMRVHFNDPLFSRTGRGLAPTPLAEQLRLRLRALVSETENILSGKEPEKPLRTQPPGSDADWGHKALIAAPPLAARPSVVLDGQPTPEIIAQNLAFIGHNDEPQRRLAKYIATSSMSIRQSRPLSREEAKDAMSIILAGEADPVQIGALLTTMQYRGPNATEVAGLLEGLWSHIGRWPQPTDLIDLDWPAYLSPRYRSPPWFIQSALLIRDAGYKVILHGHFGQGGNSGKLELAASDCGISICKSLRDASKAVADDGIAYLPIGAISPQFQRLLNLYPLLEMRLPLGLVMHLANPLFAKQIMMGVAAPSYRDLHRDVVKILGQPDISILGNIRDIAQVNPTKSTTMFGLLGGNEFERNIPAFRRCSGKNAVPFTSREYWAAIWTGAARDNQIESTITATTAAALMSLSKLEKSYEAAIQVAQNLWAKRDKRMMKTV